MATKNLVRTVCEAGNTRMYHNVRRKQRRAHRHEAKAFCRILARDPGLYDELVAPVAPEHRDREGLWCEDLRSVNLNAMSRWLQAQVGRPWDNVYSELRARLDARTADGRDFLERYFLWNIAANTHWNAQWMDYVIDEHGILRANP